MRRLFPVLLSFTPVVSMGLFALLLRDNPRIYPHGFTEASLSFWLVFVIFALLFAIHVIEAAFSLNADQRRLRGLCRQCGYNLRGNVSGVCPECGTRRNARETNDGGR